MQPAPTVRPPHDRRLINRTCWQKWKIQHFRQQKCKYITYKGSEKPGCWRFFAHLKICQQISLILLANLRNITIIATFDKIRHYGTHILRTLTRRHQTTTALERRLIDTTTNSSITRSTPWCPYTTALTRCHQVTTPPTQVAHRHCVQFSPTPRPPSLTQRGTERSCSVLCKT